jgi:hypothetical protein
MTERSAQRAEDAYGAVVDAAHADPALAERLISDGELTRFIPQADDAVDSITETVLAHDLENGGRVETQVPTLKSATRAVDPTFQLTPAGQGQAALNIRKTGNPLGGSGFPDCNRGTYAPGCAAVLHAASPEHASRH